MSEDAWPPDEAIHVLKGGRRLGPFTVDDLLDGLESGDFEEDDVCLREGAADCERIRDLLDWQDLEKEGADDESLGEEEPEEDDGTDDDGAEDGRSDAEPSPPKHAGEKKRPASPTGPPSDRLLYAGHPSALSYPVSLASLVGGVTAGIWLYGIDPKYTLAALALAAAGLVRLSLVRYSHDYHIHTRRIESVVGLLARSSREVRIEDVRAINVTCRGLSGMLGIGTIDFHTSGDAPEIVFQRVWAAQRVKTLVRRLQDAL